MLCMEMCYPSRSFWREATVQADYAMTTTSTVAICFQQKTDDCRLCITLGDCRVVDLAKISKSRLSD